MVLFQNMSGQFFAWSVVLTVHVENWVLRYFRKIEREHTGIVEKAQETSLDTGMHNTAIAIRTCTS